MNQSPLGTYKREIFQYLLSYIKNPLFAMKSVPEWSWLFIISFQFIVSITLGIISDFIFHDYYFISGTYMFPFSSFLITAFGTGFFYLLFSIFFNNQTKISKLYTIVFLSHIPFLVLKIAKTWIAPIELIGFAVTIALLTVGFVENFQLPKKRMIRIFGAIYLIYFCSWGLQQIHHSKTSLEFKRDIEKTQSMEPPKDFN